MKTPCETPGTSAFRSRNPLAQVREHIETLAAEPERSEKRDLLTGLNGWRSLFETNVIEGIATAENPRSRWKSYSGQ